MILRASNLAGPSWAVLLIEDLLIHQQRAGGWVGGWLKAAGLGWRLLGQLISFPHGLSFFIRVS